MQSIYSLNELPKLIKSLHNQKIVIAGGCFDLLHLGHIIFLQKAKQQGDRLVVLLESDETIKKLKGNKRPVHSQKIRAEILSELKSVDYVLMLPPINADEDYDKLMEKLNPKVIATTKGDEHDFHKKRQAGKFGAKLVYVTKPIEEYSTTKIIDRVLKK